MRLFTLIAGCALCAISPAHAQQAWTTSQTCVATAPASESGQPQLSFLAVAQTNEAGERTSGQQMRLQTSTALLANGEKLAGVTISVPDQKDFSDLEAVGVVRGNTNVVAIIVPMEANLLQVMSRGSSAVVTLPLAAGSQTFTFDLAGSGKAMKQLRPCVE
jgi:hypothetical protein